MRRAASAFVVLLGLIAAAVSAPIVLTPIGMYSTGIINAVEAEIVAHDAVTQRLFVVNAEASYVFDIRKPSVQARVSTIDFAPFKAATRVRIPLGIPFRVNDLHRSSSPSEASAHNRHTIKLAGGFPVRVAVG